MRKPLSKMTLSNQNIGKRIIVCIDGTWCRYDRSVDDRQSDERNWSNVQKFRTLVAERDPTTGAGQITIYSRGVGTSDRYWSQLIDGATGQGIDDQIMDAYMSVCDNYEPGDKIFLVGFSRGAVAARALAGMIEYCGVLKPERMGEFDQLWKYFKEIVNQQDQVPLESKFGAHIGNHTYNDVNIEAIGVWDTVYGSELEIRRNWGRLSISAQVNYGLTDLRFRSDRISPKIKNAFHAMSIDEQRKPFKVLPWTSQQGLPDGVTIKQVWFPGSHGNVGGGYKDARLSDISLDWMIRNFKQAGLAFHPSKVMKPILRPSIDGFHGLSLEGPWEKLGKEDRVVTALNPIKRLVGERIHASALALHGTRIPVLSGNGHREKDYILSFLDSKRPQVPPDLVEDQNLYEGYCKDLKRAGAVEFA